MDIKVKTSASEQKKIDLIQPFIKLKSGKVVPNEKFEKFYGKFKPNDITPGEKQKDQWLKSIGATEKDRKNRKYYM